MVDVGEKPATVREAVAECVVRLAPATVEAVKRGTAKGDATAVARIAGIMAAKRTPELIPLAHPLPLTKVSIDFEFGKASVRILARARVTGQTGVEMEALTAAAVAGLTLIDMTKGIERARPPCAADEWDSPPSARPGRRYRPARGNWSAGRP